MNVVARLPLKEVPRLGVQARAIAWACASFVVPLSSMLAGPREEAAREACEAACPGVPSIVAVLTMMYFDLKRPWR